MVRAQLPIRYFQLDRPNSAPRVTGSLYSHIDFVDSRMDSAMIGIIQTGPLNNQDTRLVFKEPIQPQLTALLSAMTDSTAADGTLLFQLRNYSFVETWGTRYFFIKATLYVKKENGFRELGTLDTHDAIRDSWVQLALPKIGSARIYNFLYASLTRTPTDSARYSLADIAHIDSIEKARLPLYTTDRYTDGIYLTYAAFSKQLPDMQGIIKANKDGSIAKVNIVNDSGRKQRIMPRYVYAVIYRGKPFLATDYGFYPAEKIRDNFFFTGDVRIAPTAGDVATGQMTFGLAGAVENAMGFRKTYDIIIDPENGQFIHLRQIAKTDSP